MHSKGSILQYFRPALSYYLSLRPLFCLFLSGRLRQALLYSGRWVECLISDSIIPVRKIVNIFLPISFNMFWVLKRTH